LFRSECRAAAAIAGPAGQRLLLARLHRFGLGRARQLCPGISGLDFLRDLDGIVNLNAKVANSALNFGMAQQKLDRA